MSELTTSGSMPLPPVMTATIDSGTFGTSAFTSDNKLVMSNGSPTVATYVAVNKIENWLTTIEEAVSLPRMAPHRYDLEDIYFFLKATLKKHEEQHIDVVTSAPTEADLIEYLAAYAASAAASAKEVA